MLQEATGSGAACRRQALLLEQRRLSDDGFWTTANGCYHDVAAVRKASKTEHFQRSKRIDKEEQKQRRSLCARIAAAVVPPGP